MSTVEFDEVVAPTQRALGEFVKRNPEPNQLVVSRQEDVPLAHPLGPAVRGGKQVAATMDRAASQVSEGELVAFEHIAKYVTADLAYLVWVGRTQAKLGRQESAPFKLRVTTIFRPEEGSWKVVHRRPEQQRSANRIGPPEGDQSQTVQNGAHFSSLVRSPFWGSKQAGSLNVDEPHKSTRMFSYLLPLM
jgi:ketosteroid isomerase-like protein